MSRRHKTDILLSMQCPKQPGEIPNDTGLTVSGPCDHSTTPTTGQFLQMIRIQLMDRRSLRRMQLRLTNLGLPGQ